MKGLNRCNHRERGISEAIGFILIFSIVIAGIGLVTLYGYPLLLSQQTNANERIMEKNMIVLQNDLKSLAYKTVPYKETSLKIDGGTLAVYNTFSTPPVATIDVQTCGGGIKYVDAFHPGDLRYSSESASTDISLQNGAVVLRRHFEPGSVMLAEPRWFYDTQTNTVVINLIGVSSPDSMARSGIGTVRMAMGETTYSQYDLPAGNPICIVYAPDSSQNYEVAWTNYFTNSLKMTPTGTPNEYRLPMDAASPSTLVIKKYNVMIKSL